MMPSMSSPDDIGPPKANVQRNKSDRLLSKPFGEYSILAQLQIEKLRLKFLRNCLNLIIPPSSIRISGANAIGDNQKLYHLSCTETKMLGLAIKNKLKIIQDLTMKLKNSIVVQTPLTDKDTKSLSDHFESKLKFMKSQDSTKWKQWPRKSSEILKNVSDRKHTNYKRRENHRHKLVEKRAEKALKDGSVFVLVDNIGEIPAGAISVLSKGLGFIPTPEPNNRQFDTRLDMRLVTNKIVKASNENTARHCCE